MKNYSQTLDKMRLAIYNCIVELNALYFLNVLLAVANNKLQKLNKIIFFWNIVSRC